MSAQNPCLTDAQFQALLESAALELERRECEAHLTECVRCRERLDALAGGRELWRARKSPTGAAPDSKPLREAMARLKAGFETVPAVPQAIVPQPGARSRYIKPGNILLDRAGVPHVTDFGLAKLVEHDSGLTRSAAVMGTPNYMAPEVAAGHAREATTAADVYSLGGILFELLTGRPPFQAETVAATLQKVLNAEPPSLRSRNSAVACDLETICHKWLEKEPGRRYASAEALADAWWQID